MSNYQDQDDFEEREDKLKIDGSNEGKNPEFVKIKVVGDNRNGIYFKLKLTTKFIKLKEYYSTHVGLPAYSLKFLFDGVAIADDDTPKMLNLKDDDQIDVYYSQTGGSHQPSFIIKEVLTEGHGELLRRYLN